MRRSDGKKPRKGAGGKHEYDIVPALDRPGDPAKYINGSGEVEGRIRYFVVGPIFDNNWKASIDLAQFRYMQ